MYLNREAADFRQSINGLAALVEQALGSIHSQPQCSVFRNRRADRIKMLLWDRNVTVRRVPSLTDSSIRCVLR